MTNSEIHNDYDPQKIIWSNTIVDLQIRLQARKTYVLCFAFFSFALAVPYRAIISFLKIRLQSTKPNMGRYGGNNSCRYIGYYAAIYWCTTTYEMSYTQHAFWFVLYFLVWKYPVVSGIPGNRRGGGGGGRREAAVWESRKEMKDRAATYQTSPKR